MTECRTCGHPLRSGRDHADGTTRVRRAGGLCIVCYKAATRPAHQQQDEITPEQHAWNVYAYEAWRADRRKRGVPESGHAPDRTPIQRFTRYLEAV